MKNAFSSVNRGRLAVAIAARAVARPPARASARRGRASRIGGLNRGHVRVDEARRHAARVNENAAWISSNGTRTVLPFRSMRPISLSAWTSPCTFLGPPQSLSSHYAHVAHEVAEQRVYRREVVAVLAWADVSVIALAGFVVIPEITYTEKEGQPRELRLAGAGPSTPEGTLRFHFLTSIAQ